MDVLARANLFEVAELFVVNIECAQNSMEFGILGVVSGRLLRGVTIALVNGMV